MTAALPIVPSLLMGYDDVGEAREVRRRDRGERLQILLVEGGVQPLGDLHVLLRHSRCAYSESPAACNASAWSR
jgi:hypothetical protein